MVCYYGMLSQVLNIIAFLKIGKEGYDLMHLRNSELSEMI